MSGMIRDVFGCSDAIYNYLTQKCADCTLRFKASSSVEAEDYAEVTPQVYEFTFDDASEIPSPCVLVQPVNVTASNVHFVLFISVAHGGIQECEIVDEDPTGSRQYVYRDGTDFTSDGVRRELYRACMSLQTFVFNAMLKLSSSDARIQNLTLNPPSPYMESFPACEGTVEFDMSYDTRTVAYAGTRLQDLL